MSGAIKETRIELVVKADAKALWERFQILPRGEHSEFDYIANELNRGGGQNGPLFKGHATDTQFFVEAVKSCTVPPGTPMALVLGGIPSLGVRNFIRACLGCVPQKEEFQALGKLEWNPESREMDYVENPLRPVVAVLMDSGDDLDVLLAGQSIHSVSFNEHLLPQGEFESKLTMTLFAQAAVLDEMIKSLKSFDAYTLWLGMHEGIDFSLELKIDGKIQEITERSNRRRMVEADSPPAIPERRDFGGRRYESLPFREDPLVPSKAFRHAPSVKRSFAIGAAVAIGVLVVFVVAVSIMTYGVAVPVIAGLFGALTSVIGGSVGASAALAFIGLGGGVKVLKDHRSNQNLALAVGQTKRNSARPEDKSLLPDGRASSGAASGSVSSVTVTPQEA
jgi:hypothetical protein